MNLSPGVEPRDDTRSPVGMAARTLAHVRTCRFCRRPISFNVRNVRLNTSSAHIGSTPPLSAFRPPELATPNAESAWYPPDPALPGASRFGAPQRSTTVVLFGTMADKACQPVSDKRSGEHAHGRAQAIAGGRSYRQKRHHLRTGFHGG